MSVQTNDLEILQRARNSWQAGQHDAALEQFESATREHPDNVRASLERATALGKRYRIHEACNLLNTARQRAGHLPHVAAKISGVYADLFRKHLAIECLEGIPEASRSPEIWGRLAVYYELSGRFEEAEEAINRCLDEEPDQPEPNLILARILNHQGHSERAFNVLDHLHKQLRKPPPLLAIRMLYDMAIVLDRLGQYESAVQAALAAKEIQKQKPGAVEQSQRIMQQGFDIGKIFQELNRETLDRWFDCNLPALPGNVRPAHLIGHPRSGTTLLEQVLDAHQDIVTSSERNVFAEEILPQLIRPDASSKLESVDSVSTQELEELRRTYIDFLWSTHPRDFADKVHIDKKPANTLFLFGLLRLLPESKLIVAIRDPRDVLVSCFLRFFPLRDLSYCYLTWGGTAISYAQIMEIWLYMRDLLADDRWLEVRYEDTCANTNVQSSRVFEFLGLGEDENVKDYLKTTQDKFVDSPTFAEVRKPTHSKRIGRWKNYEKFLEPHLETLAPFAEALGYET